MSIKYKEIAEVLAHQIREGLYDKTKKLPTEDELIEEFEVSRNTIRKAIDTLVKHSLVMPIQGSGVQILEDSEEGTISLDTFRGMTDSFPHSKITSIIVKFELITADAVIAKNLNCKVGTPVYYIERVRHYDNKPYVFEKSYYNKKVIPYLSDEIISKSIYSYISNDLNMQIGFVHRSLAADRLDEYVAPFLGLEAGDPALITKNTAMLKSGVIFDFSYNYHHYKNTKFSKLANSF